MRENLNRWILVAVGCGVAWITPVAAEAGRYKVNGLDEPKNKWKKRRG
jgi:hypothetical protein